MYCQGESLFSLPCLFLSSPTDYLSKISSVVIMTGHEPAQAAIHRSTSMFTPVVQLRHPKWSLFFWFFSLSLPRPLPLHSSNLVPGGKFWRAASTSLTPNDPPSLRSSGSQAAEASPSLNFPPANFKSTLYTPAPRPVILAKFSSNEATKHCYPPKMHGRPPQSAVRPKSKVQHI